jgi:hypothetical protein
MQGLPYSFSIMEGETGTTVPSMAVTVISGDVMIRRRRMEKSSRHPSLYTIPPTDYV